MLVRPPGWQLAGMASSQALLPFLGHSVVVLTNENQSPARFALMLTLLDAMLGLEPPTPSWTERYVAEVVNGRLAMAAITLSVALSADPTLKAIVAVYRWVEHPLIAPAIAPRRLLLVCSPSAHRPLAPRSLLVVVRREWLVCALR